MAEAFRVFRINTKRALLARLMGCAPTKKTAPDDADAQTESPKSAQQDVAEWKKRAKAIALKLRAVPIEIDRVLSDPRWDRKISRIACSILQDVDQADKDRLVELTAAASRVGDRALGAFVGLAVGDWVGAPLEFLDAVQTPKATSYWDMGAFAYLGPLPENKERDALQLGQFTDDTSMALCLADSLLSCGEYDGSDVRKRYWSWHAEGMNNCFRNDESRARRHSFGLGYNICRGLSQLTVGEPVPPFFVDESSDDSGNGSLMRLAPVPIFCAHASDAELRRMAMDSSRSTHTGKLAAECCACWAFLVRHAIVRPSTHARAREVIDEGIKRYMEVYAADTSPELKSLLLADAPADGKEACWRWREPVLRLEATAEARGEQYNGYPFTLGYFGSFCVDALAIALHVNYHNADFESTVAHGANLLGDADTNAAIAGQLAGAVYGYSGIDPRYVEALRRWDDGEIATRAALLLAAAS